MSDFVDPYLDDKTGILRNLLNAGTNDELKDLEAQIVFANELELEEIGIKRTSRWARIASDSKKRCNKAC